MAKPLSPATVSTPDPQIIDANSDLDSAFFFEENKGKISAAVVICLLLLAGFVGYQYFQGRNRAEAAAAFYNAKTEADWRNVVAKYPGTVVAGNSQLLLADKLNAEGKSAEALAVLTDFAKNNPTHPLIAEGMLAEAATLELKGDLPKAAQTYSDIAAQYSTTEAAPLALANQARLAKKAGDLKKARSIYENIVQRYPTSYWSQDAQQEISRLPSA